MIKKVELLAPVKDRECQQAVIENGADSVYMGYQQFNARMFGKNFNGIRNFVRILNMHTKIM